MATFDEPLCGCLNDLSSCCITWCIPCGLCYIQATAVDEATGNGCGMPFVLSLFGCIGQAINRGKIREQYGISGNFVEDMLLHWCCILCSTTQEYREVKRRGK